MLNSGQVFEYSRINSHLDQKKVLTQLSGCVCMCEKFASRMNLKSGPWFAKVWFVPSLCHNPNTESVQMKLEEVYTESPIIFLPLWEDTLWYLCYSRFSFVFEVLICFTLSYVQIPEGLMTYRDERKRLDFKLFLFPRLQMLKVLTSHDTVACM